MAGARRAAEGREAQWAVGVAERGVGSSTALDVLLAVQVASQVVAEADWPGLMDRVRASLKERLARAKERRQLEIAEYQLMSGGLAAEAVPFPLLPDSVLSCRESNEVVIISYSRVLNAVLADEEVYSENPQ